MPLPESEPAFEIVNLLVDEWNDANIDPQFTFKTAWISTGWWDEATPNPQITFSNAREDTTPDGMHPTGQGGTADVAGIVDCNVWVPDSDDYASSGVAKDFRYDLKWEAHRIINEHQTGIEADDGTRLLTRLNTGVMRDDPVDPPPPYRTLIEVHFAYHTVPATQRGP